MKNVLFVGFKSDYADQDVEGLKSRYRVKRLVVGTLMVSILLQVRAKSNSAFIFFMRIYYLIFLFRVKKDTIIISDDNPISLQCIKSLRIRDNRKICIFRNIIPENFDFDVIKGSEFYSFDKRDCRKYGAQFYHQYCSGYEFLLNTNGQKEVFDFYFLGRNKGRFTTLSKLADVIGDYKRKIVLVGEKYSLMQNGIECSDYISYDNHLEMLSKSKVVIDIVQPGQVGPTMRAIEALIAGKKIITNNYELLSYKGFGEYNTFVFNDADQINKAKLGMFFQKKLIAEARDISACSPYVVITSIIEGIKN